MQRLLRALPPHKPQAKQRSTPPNCRSCRLRIHLTNRVLKLVGFTPYLHKLMEGAVTAARFHLGSRETSSRQESGVAWGASRDQAARLLLTRRYLRRVVRSRVDASDAARARSRTHSRAPAGSAGAIVDNREAPANAGRGGQNTSSYHWSAEAGRSLPGAASTAARWARPVMQPTRPPASGPGAT